MSKQWRKILVTGVVAGMFVVLLSGFAGAAGMNGQGFNIGKSMGGLKVAVAQFLGIETEAVIAARQDGVTLRELLEDKNIDVEAFVKAQVSARKEVMEQLVAEGKMTAEQAALCLANLEANIDAKLDNANTCTGLGQGQGGNGCGIQARGGRGAGRMMRNSFSWGK